MADFDVNEINPTVLILEDVSALHRNIEGAGTPISPETGGLYDGTSIMGSDCVVIVGNSEYTTIPITTSQENLRSGIIGKYHCLFNPSRTIYFSAPDATRVSMEVLNITGQMITTLLDNNMELGVHSGVWDGRDSNGSRVADGICFYRIETGDINETRKTVLLK